PSYSPAKPSNASYSPSYVPVASFAGRTSGIGQAIAESLAGCTQGKAHIILIGHNSDAAARVIAGFPL
ncbi:hypothetical protein B0H16DRAFT_1272698, partial [Mycena metata]